VSVSNTDERYTPSGKRILGLPVQFVIVAVVSLALTIYMAGWAASNNIEARSFRTASMNGIPAYQSAVADAEAENWERAALLICPLH
jgi:hypothetical protein